MMTVGPTLDGRQSDWYTISSLMSFRLGRAKNHNKQPYKVSFVQVWTLSDKWLLNYMYGLLENSNTKILSFGYVLDSDL